jgi:hypothetical protein
LLNHILTVNDVSNNVNLDKLLKSNLGYCELTHIITFIDYLDHLQKDIFVMIRKTGPPTFFVTFTTSVNNWSILMMTLKDTFQTFSTQRKMIFNDLLTNRDLL